MPDRPIQEVRALTRTCKQLVREKAAHVQRIHKTLEDANLKLGSAARDIMGLSGRTILHAPIAGETDPERLADLTRGRLKAPRATLLESLRGTVTKNHRFLLQLHVDQIAGLDAAIAALDAKVDSLLAALHPVTTRLSSIPGVSDVVAQVLVAEVGTDMARFPTVGHLISWAGLCPRNDESVGKRRSTRLRKGAPWLETALVQAAWCATRAKPNYLRSQFLRLKGRRGPRKAVVAVAASILTAAYFIIRDGVDYRELGADHFDCLDQNKKARRLLRQLTDLGYDVTNVCRAR